MAYASVDHTEICRGTADCHHVWTVLPFLGQAQRIHRGLIKADLLQLVLVDRALQVGITTVLDILLFWKKGHSGRKLYTFTSSCWFQQVL